MYVLQPSRFPLKEQHLRSELTVESGAMATAEAKSTKERRQSIDQASVRS